MSPRAGGPLEAFAVAPPGFEDLVLAELLGLGLAARPVEGGVAFSAPWAGIYRANLESRVASRVLVRVASFEAERPRELEAALARVDWAAWLPRGAGVAVKVAKHRTRLYHTGLVAERTADALASAVGSAVAPDGLGVYLRLEGPRVTVSLDTSGEHLHRRGYRRVPGAAPLRENLAAGLLLRAGWSGAEPFLDPFCGSGTLAAEAAWIALRVAPGSLRSFAFEGLPGFDARSWARVRADAEARGLASLPNPVYAADRDPAALRTASAALSAAGLAEHVQVALCPLEELEAPCAAGLLAANPPYGERLGGAGEAYRALGSALRTRLRGWRWAAVFPRGNARLERDFGLPAAGRHPFRSGGLRLDLALGPPSEAERTLP